MNVKRYEEMVKAVKVEEAKHLTKLEQELAELKASVKLENQKFDALRKLAKDVVEETDRSPAKKADFQKRLDSISNMSFDQRM